jgi:hypothetical protein
MVHTSRSKASSVQTDTHGIASLSARRPLVLRYGLSARLQGVGLVAEHPDDSFQGLPDAHAIVQNISTKTNVATEAGADYKQGISVQPCGREG